MIRTIVASLLLLGSSAFALEPEEIRAKLEEARPGLPIIEISQSTLPGFYEVSLSDGSLLIVTEDGNHFIAGDLYRVEPVGFVNVTEERRSRHRKEMLKDLDESKMLVFAPPEGEVKGTITVFTDIDCGYCRKLHREIPELNDLGIAVRYLAYPRAGVASNSYDKYVSAWCSDNPELSLTKAKLGQEIDPRTCDNPIAEQFALGGEFGVTGTPAIVFENGMIQMGYSPAPRLAQRMGILN